MDNVMECGKLHAKWVVIITNLLGTAAAPSTGSGHRGFCLVRVVSLELPTNLREDFTIMEIAHTELKALLD